MLQWSSCCDLLTFTEDNAIATALQELCNEVPAAKQLFDRASDILGYDLLQVCVEGVQHVCCFACDFSSCVHQTHGHFTSQLGVMDCPCVPGPKEKLNSTAVSQPAIYVASLAAVEKLRATEGEASCVSNRACCDAACYPVTCLAGRPDSALWDCLVMGRDERVPDLVRRRFWARQTLPPA